MLSLLSPPSGTGRPCQPEKQTATVEALCGAVAPRLHCVVAAPCDGIVVVLSVEKVDYGDGAGMTEAKSG